MLLFLLAGRAPLFLVVLLGALLYLTWIEVKDEDMTNAWKLWWVALVLLTNVLGYLVLRIVMLRRRRAAGGAGD